uniref:Uncharacterized protein n=1 Tax=Rhizophora mucronata TaxID=61149 RepID=A0A2P2PGC5_RHIMU
MGLWATLHLFLNIIML